MPKKAWVLYEDLDATGLNSKKIGAFDKGDAKKLIRYWSKAGHRMSAWDEKGMNESVLYWDAATKKVLENHEE